MIWNLWKKFVTLKKLSLFWHMRIWKRGINLEHYGWAPHKILRCTSTLHREHDIVWKVSIRWLENCGRCSWHNISLTDWPSAKSSFICGRIRICYTMKHHQQYYIISSYIILYNMSNKCLYHIWRFLMICYQYFEHTVHTQLTETLNFK